MAKKKAKKRAPARAQKAPKKVSAIPPGYRTVTPYLTVNDGPGALAFYARAFGAREVMRMPAAGGKLGHAEFRIGDAGGAAQRGRGLLRAVGRRHERLAPGVDRALEGGIDVAMAQMAQGGGA